MRYFTKLQGQKEPLALDLEATGGDAYRLTLGGATHTVDALILESGMVSLIVDGKSFQVEVEPRGEELSVQVKGQSFLLDVADERKMRVRAATATFSVEGRQVISAPMPGKVTKILVKLGDEVAEGQGLVVVEAMKMENELKSPKAGKVVEITAKEGTAVENNAKLLVVE